MKKAMKKIWGWIKAPFIWMGENLKDWRTAVIFGIVFLVLSSEVGVPYILGFVIVGARAYLWSIGSACGLFWLGPGTPFLPLCMGITVGIKALFNKIRSKHEKKHSKDIDDGHSSAEPMLVQRDDNESVRQDDGDPDIRGDSR